MSDERDITFTEELNGELELTGQAVGVGRVVRPGDVLVLSMPPEAKATTPQLVQLRDELRKLFPDLADVVVLGALRFEFVYRKAEP